MSSSSSVYYLSVRPFSHPIHSPKDTQGTGGGGVKGFKTNESEKKKLQSSPHTN